MSRAADHPSPPGDRRVDASEADLAGQSGSLPELPPLLSAPGETPGRITVAADLTPPAPPALMPAEPGARQWDLEPTPPAGVAPTALNRFLEPLFPPASLPAAVAPVEPHGPAPVVGARRRRPRSRLSLLLVWAAAVSAGIAVAALALRPPAQARTPPRKTAPGGELLPARVSVRPARLTCSGCSRSIPHRSRYCPYCGKRIRDVP